jgi:hypothetical protein
VTSGFGVNAAPQRKHARDKLPPANSSRRTPLSAFPSGCYRPQLKKNKRGNRLT